MQTYPLCKDIVEQSLLKTFIAVNQFTDSKLNSNGIYSKTKMSIRMLVRIKLICIKLVRINSRNTLKYTLYLYLVWNLKNLTN